MPRPIFLAAIIAAEMFLSLTHASPPELAALQAQYEKLLGERVEAAYNTGLKNLTSSYISGIERAADEARRSGDLNTVLALEEEKKSIQSGKPPVVSTETSFVVTRLRSIYQAELSKIEATRVASKAELLKPYLIRLQLLQESLTKANRINEAKEVLAYREGLSTSAVAPIPASTTFRSAPPNGVVNLLGMRFVPVPGTDVLMCIHETRKQDYAVFASETPGADPSWKTALYDGVAVSDADDHPVVNVSWHDAQSFCEWLSKKENRRVRLPRDREWSAAVGIARKEKADAPPDILHTALRDQYPWGGTRLPPPKGAGNYGDISAKKVFPTMTIIEDYDDGFPTTAPVMSFAPNDIGIYDLGGNVWEWCEEWFNQKISPGKVLRGGCWFNIESGGNLSSYRSRRSPTERSPLRGFRCVIDLKPD